MQALIACQSLAHPAWCQAVAADRVLSLLRCPAVSSCGSLSVKVLPIFWAGTVPKHMKTGIGL